MEQVFEIRLIDRFSLHRGPQRITLPYASSRLVAFLALPRSPQMRSYVAGQLWPELSEARARANLRNAVWRTQPLGEGLLQCHGDSIGLAQSVIVDVTHVRRSAEELLHPSGYDGALPRAEMFGQEMLVDWSDDWALFERERLKQLCLHALEVLSERLLEERAYANAVDAALLAVRLEPLRESAHRALSRAYLVEGNVAQARLQFDRYADLLRNELGLRPSREYWRLVQSDDERERLLA